MTARFEMTSSIGQRCILQYMLPWLANVELVDLSNSFPTPPELNIETEEEEEETDAMSPVKLEGEGWGSVEATQLVLNNLFYITVKVSATGFWTILAFHDKVHVEAPFQTEGNLRSLVTSSACRMTGIIDQS